MVHKCDGCGKDLANEENTHCRRCNTDYCMDCIVVDSDRQGPYRKVWVCPKCKEDIAS